MRLRVGVAISLAGLDARSKKLLKPGEILSMLSVDPGEHDMDLTAQTGTRRAPRKETLPPVENRKVHQRLSVHRKMRPPPKGSVRCATCARATHAPKCGLQDGPTGKNV